MKLGSIFASAAGSSGGNSTTRIAVPLSGGDRPIGLAALSSLNEKPGGDESVIHRLAAGMPDFPGLRVKRLSNSAIALLVASSPVTTRRTSAAVPVEHANMMVTIDQNVLRTIVSSLLCPNATCLQALSRPSAGIPDHRLSAWQPDNIRRCRQGPRLLARPRARLASWALSPRAVAHDGRP